MGGFNVGGFAQGLNSGMDSMSQLQLRAQQIKAAQFQLDQQKRALAAQGMAAGVLGGFDPSQGGGQPQMGPSGPGNGPPAAVPMPGATPMPPAMQGAPAAPQGPGGVAPMQRPPMPQQPPAPMGGGGVPAQGAGVPDGMPASPPQTGQQQVAQDSDPTAYIQKGMAMAKRVMIFINQKYPNADPSAKLQAFNDYMETVKGITQPELQAAKITADAYAKIAGIGQRATAAEEQHEDRRAAIEERGQAAGGTLAERIRHDKANELTAKSRAATYAEFVTLSHEDRQSAIAAANERQDKALAGQMDRLDKALEDKDWTTVNNIMAKNYSTEAGAQSRAVSPSNVTAKPPAITPRGPTASSQQRGPRKAVAPQNAPPVPGARKAPDGKWYVQVNGKWNRVDQ